MNRSYLNPNERARLKAATRDLVDRAGGPNEAAQHTRVAASLLSRYGNEGPEHEGTFCPVDVARELELTAGEPILTRLLADMGGFDLVARKAVTPSPADFDLHDTDVTRATCALLVAFREARTDGKLCAVDLTTIEALAADLMRELAELRADAQRAIGDVIPLRRA